MCVLLRISVLADPVYEQIVCKDGRTKRQPFFTRAVLEGLGPDGDDFGGVGLLLVPGLGARLGLLAALGVHAGLHEGTLVARAHRGAGLHLLGGRGGNLAQI